jgi:hypothetical protein
VSFLLFSCTITTSAVDQGTIGSEDSDHHFSDIPNDDINDDIDGDDGYLSLELRGVRLIYPKVGR